MVEEKYYKEKHVLIINTLNGITDLGITTEIPKLYSMGLANDPLSNIKVTPVIFYKYADINQTIHMINLHTITSIDNFLLSFYDKMRIDISKKKEAQKEAPEDDGLGIEGFSEAN